jgi:ATP-dependent DNA helicase RecG
VSLKGKLLIHFINKNTNLLIKCINSLPFKLTQSQENSLNEIIEDLKSENQMIRLLQGDTVSGKTIIALLSLIHAIDSNYQGALMAPTSILAQQHFNNFSTILKPLNIKIVLLTGKDTGKSRLKKLHLIKSGEAQIIIGTHALIQDSVSYNSIGLVVCDESHRFGVFQRLSFTNKGKKPNVLTMSGTPIPRSQTQTTNPIEL